MINIDPVAIIAVKFHFYPIDSISFISWWTKKKCHCCASSICSYTFKNIGYLRRAMTHSSFSQENNKALSILGSNVIDTSVSMYYLGKDIEISSKDLNRWISENAKVDTSCAVDGMRLGLHRVVRVSPKTNSTAPTVVCSAFRAIFGAIAIDTRKVDDAGSVFWNVHCSEVGRVMDMWVSILFSLILEHVC